MKLPELVDMLRGEIAHESPATVEFVVKDGMPPALLERLAKLQRLNLLDGDVLLSMVAQAPVDPLGLIGQLMIANPVGWVFSAIDCSVVRVLSRTTDGAVAAALRIDLLDDSVETLVLSKAQQLTSFKRFESLAACERRQPGPWLLQEVQRMADEAIIAATREN